MICLFGQYLTAIQAVCQPPFRNIALSSLQNLVHLNLQHIFINRVINKDTYPYTIGKLILITMIIFLNIVVKALFCQYALIYFLTLIYAQSIYIFVFFTLHYITCIYVLIKINCSQLNYNYKTFGNQEINNVLYICTLQFIQIGFRKYNIAICIYKVQIVFPRNKQNKEHCIFELLQHY